MYEAIDFMREMVDKHLAMGLKARMEAQINIVECELRERDKHISELEATHGTLTAEQVKKCAQAVYLDGYSDGSAGRGYHIGETDWQAIADELNALRGRTCVILPIKLNDYLGKCSACGNIADVFSTYCWKCGSKVK